MKSFVIKGNICYSANRDSIESRPGAYLVCEDGVCAGVFDTLPACYGALALTDFGDRLIIPGMTDLHIHAAQYAFRGMYMDEQLLDWLVRHAFPEESKFRDTAYAERAYTLLVSDLKAGATTRACMFASAHSEATEILMRLTAEAGLGAYIGRVNMDMDAPDSLREPSAEFSAEETLRWIERTAEQYELVKPILTPRFVLSCSRELLERLSAIEERLRLPVQSHLSENLDEIGVVALRFPEHYTYGEVYDRYNLFGGIGKTVMAHCVYSTDREIELMKKRGVFIAHCPASNTNIITGIAPARKYLDRDMKLGLASDVAGGHSASLFHAMVDAIQMSKQYWRYVDSSAAPLSFAEAFYLATKGGGEFFGKVGSFEPGYELDALVLDDAALPCPNELSLCERLERAVYLGLDERGGICAKYVAGKKIL